MSGFAKPAHKAAELVANKKFFPRRSHLGVINSKTQKGVGDKAHNEALTA